MIIISQYKNCYLVKTNSNDNKCYLVDMNLNTSLGYDYPEKFMRYYRFEDYKSDKYTSKHLNQFLKKYLIRWKKD